jgi:hypothetical protein
MESGFDRSRLGFGGISGTIRRKSDGGGNMNAWLFLGGLFTVMVWWISSLLILARLKSLKAERYQFSDLFYPGIYEKCELAPQFGWSRIPVFMLPIPGVYSGLVILMLSLGK